MPAAETKRDGKGEFLAKDLSIWRQTPGPGADAGSGSRIQVDELMQLLRRDIADKRLLALIGRYLRAGVLVGEHLQPSEVGTPQGGPLPPLLVSIFLRPNSTASWSGGATALRGLFVV